MRWIKFAVFGFLILLAVYAASMYFVDESKSFTVEKEIDYPLEKVYPQFSNLQNFARWNQYFSDSKNMSVAFFSPYEGQGASMTFSEKKGRDNGEMYIRYENPYKTLKYQLFENGENLPYLIDVRFKLATPEKTKLIWTVHTPKLSWMKRSINLWTESDFVENLDKSMLSLANILSNKVDRDQQLASIKYDSIMVEENEGNLLIGVNVSSSNKGDALFKNIVHNHNKVNNFVTMDLGKSEDEFGLPVMLTEAGNFKDKEVSYFYGIPLSKRTGISDNNFIFRTSNPSKQYVIFYKGKYGNRIKSIQQLLTKAKKDSMRNGELQQTFIEPPVDGKEVNVKLALPVYK